MAERRAPQVRFEIRFAQASEGRTSDECWPWPGPLNDEGYPTSTSNGRRPYRRAWELANQQTIPEGMQVDHRCHSESDCDEGKACPHRSCVNPAHLRLLSGAANTALRSDWRRGTCIKGHPWTPEFGYVRKCGTWRCRPCHAVSRAASKRRALLRRGGVPRGPRSAPTRASSPAEVQAMDGLRAAAEHVEQAKEALRAAILTAASCGVDVATTAKLARVRRETVAKLVEKPPTEQEAA